MEQNNQETQELLKDLRELREKTVALNNNLRDMLRGFRDMFENLGVVIKYLVFDLEATKRENDLLRKEMEKLENEDFE